jgi:hypothetical protein
MKGGLKMGNCEEYKKLIPFYVDNEIEDDDRLRIEEHMKNCRNCLEEKDELMKIVELCRGIGDEELPENFNEQLHEKLLLASADIKKKVGLLAIRGKYIGVLSAAAASILMIVFFRGMFFSPFGANSSHSPKDDSYLYTENRATYAGKSAVETHDATMVEAGSRLPAPQDNINKDSGTQDMQGESAEAPSSCRLMDIKDEALEHDEITTDDIRQYVVIHPKPSEQEDKIRELAMQNGASIVDELQEEAGDDLQNEYRVVFRTENTNIDKIINVITGSYGISNVKKVEMKVATDVETDIDIRYNVDIKFSEAKGIEETSGYTYITIIIKDE